MHVRRRRGRHRHPQAAAWTPAPRTSSSATADGVVCTEREDLVARGGELVWIAEHTNPRGVRGSLKDALVGADVFIGVSAADLLDGDDIATMADGRDRLRAWPTPTPRSTRTRRAQHAAVVATGRSDFANQINNVLAFPGVFRGLLDAPSRQSIPDEVLLAAAQALAGSRHRRRAQRGVHRAERLPPRRDQGRAAAAVQEAAPGRAPGEATATADCEPQAASA